MKLKAIVDTIEEVDEKYRDCYVETADGKWQLDVDGITAHPDTLALKSAHDRTKTRVRELTAEIAPLKAKAEELPEDFDRDLYDRAVTEGVGGAGGTIKNEAEVRREAAEAATTKANKDWQKKFDGVVGERDGLKTRVERDERNKALDAALDSVKVTDPAYRRGARALLASQIKVVETDGQYEALATDPDLGDIPVAEFVKTWAGTDEGKAYIGAPNSAGGGASGGGPGGNAPDDSSDNPWKAKTFNATRQAAIRRDNPALATKLMREAGVKAPVT